MVPAFVERPVSVALARSLIEAQFPALSPVHVEPLGFGMDNSAFRVNEGYVFRFPHRAFAVSFLESETRLLPFLAPRLPLPVPRPTFLGRPSEAYPWPFTGYPLLAGRTACAAALDEEQRAAAAEPLARFLAALHAIPGPEAARHGAGLDTLDRLSPRRTPTARTALGQLAQRGLVTDLRPLLAILETPVPGQVRTDGVVHGDLHVRHLLVDEDNRLCGVIDWGDVHLGDPAVDLALAHTFLPASAHATFRRAYGPLSDATWGLARLRAVRHTVALLAYADRVGDADLVREAQVGLCHLVCA
jgi:aminoglycoside phosphotransferase (APT) family kinase protein